MIELLVCSKAACVKRGLDLVLPKAGPFQGDVARMERRFSFEGECHFGDGDRASWRISREGSFKVNETTSDVRG